MFKKYYFSIACMLASIFCLVMYRIKGQTLAVDGTLKEAFAFIPLGWMFLFASAISFIVITFLKFKRKA